MPIPCSGPAHDQYHDRQGVASGHRGVAPARGDRSLTLAVLTRDASPSAPPALPTIGDKDRFLQFDDPIGEVEIDDGILVDVDQEGLLASITDNDHLDLIGAIEDWWREGQAQCDFA